MFEVLQGVRDQALGAHTCYSDGVVPYCQVYYQRAQHVVAPGEAQIYSVEGENAELRHYLARLRRKTRCFSKCLEGIMHCTESADSGLISQVASSRVRSSSTFGICSNCASD